MLDGPTEVSLEHMGVKTPEELMALPTPEVANRLARAPFPPSEKLIGALLLKAVDELRTATAKLAQSSSEMERKAQTQIATAWLTLAVAFISLVVAVIAVLK